MPLVKVDPNYKPTYKAQSATEVRKGYNPLVHGGRTLPGQMNPLTFLMSGAQPQTAHMVTPQPEAFVPTESFSGTQETATTGEVGLRMNQAIQPLTRMYGKPAAWPNSIKQAVLKGLVQGSRETL